MNRCPKNGCGPLHWACRGDEELVGLLIAAGAEVNAKTAEGRTPLYYAVESGSRKIVQTLLKAKANPNLRDKKGWSPMAVAAEKGSLDAVAALRDAGAQEPSWTKLHEAAISGKPETVAELCKDKTNLDTANVYGRTPLYWALRCNDEKAADMLVDAGAKLTVVDKQHKSILHVAVWAGRLDIARKTVAAGANVTAADDEGYTALHWAAVAENAEIVRFLLEKGANVNAATRSGDTPLLLGLQARKPELVKALLAAGADPLAVNSEGKSIESEALESLRQGSRGHARAGRQRGDAKADRPNLPPVFHRQSASPEGRGHRAGHAESGCLKNEPRLVRPGQATLHVDVRRRGAGTGGRRRSSTTPRKTTSPSARS